MFALLTALASEAEDFISKTIVGKIDHWNGYKFAIGIFGNQECIIASTGIGKVHSAVVTTHIIDTYNPKAVFYTGIAGALKGDWNIGDVLIARDCVQWDVDITPFGFKPGELPSGNANPENTERSDTAQFYSTDDDLAAKALTWKHTGFKVGTGRILTGDSFISDHLRKERKNLLIDLDGDIAEMEGAAAAAAARMQDVPFFLARVISDTADGRKPKRFKQFLKESSVKMAGLVDHILGNDFS